MGCPVCGWFSCSCSRRDLEDWHDRHWAGGDVRSRWDVEERIDELKHEERREEARRDEEQQEREAEERRARHRAEERARQEEEDYYRQQEYEEQRRQEMDDLQPTPCDENAHAREEVGTCWCGALCYDREGNPIDDADPRRKP